MDELKEAISLGFQEMALRLQAMEPRRAEAQQPPEESNKVAVQRIEIHCTGCHQKSEEVDSTTQRPGSKGRERLCRIEDDDYNQGRGSKGRGRLRRMTEDPRAWMAKGQGKGAEARKMGQRPRFTAMVARNTLRQQGQDAGNDADEQRC